MTGQQLLLLAACHIGSTLFTYLQILMMFVDHVSIAPSINPKSHCNDQRNYNWDPLFGFLKKLILGERIYETPTDPADFSASVFADITTDSMEKQFWVQIQILRSSEDNSASTITWREVPSEITTKHILQEVLKVINLLKWQRFIYVWAVEGKVTEIGSG